MSKILHMPFRGTDQGAMEPQEKKYYAIIGRHPFERLENEWVDIARNRYRSIGHGGLFRTRSNANVYAKFLRKEKGMLDVTVCLVAPLKRHVKEPKLT